MNKERQQPLLDLEAALVLVAQLLQELHLGGVERPARDGFGLEVVGIDRLGVVEVAALEQALLLEHPADELEPLPLLDSVEHPVAETNGPFLVQVVAHGAPVVMDHLIFSVQLEHVALVGPLITQRRLADVTWVVFIHLHDHAVGRPLMALLRVELEVSGRVKVPGAECALEADGPRQNAGGCHPLQVLTRHIRVLLLGAGHRRSKSRMIGVGRCQICHQLTAFPLPGQLAVVAPGLEAILPRRSVVVLEVEEVLRRQDHMDEVWLLLHALFDEGPAWYWLDASEGVHQAVDLAKALLRVVEVLHVFVFLHRALVSLGAVVLC